GNQTAASQETLAFHERAFEEVVNGRTRAALDGGFSSGADNSQSKVAQRCGDGCATENRSCFIRIVNRKPAFAHARSEPRTERGDHVRRTFVVVSAREFGEARRFRSYGAIKANGTGR